MQVSQVYNFLQGSISWEGGCDQVYFAIAVFKKESAEFISETEFRSDSKNKRYCHFNHI